MKSLSSELSELHALQLFFALARRSFSYPGQSFELTDGGEAEDLLSGIGCAYALSMMVRRMTGEVTLPKFRWSTLLRFLAPVCSSWVWLNQSGARRDQREAQFNRLHSSFRLQFYNITEFYWFKRWLQCNSESPTRPLSEQREADLASRKAARPQVCAGGDSWLPIVCGGHVRSRQQLLALMRTFCLSLRLRIAMN